MPRGAKPKPPGEATTHHPKAHPFRVAEGVGWQHGEVPEPPVDLSGAALEAWSAWFGSWWAWFWQPEDVPSLRMIIGLFDQVHRGSLDSSKLMPWMDRFGLTPKGRQDLRWQPQEAAKPEPEVADEVATKRAARRGRIA